MTNPSNYLADIQNQTVQKQDCMYRDCVGLHSAVRGCSLKPADRFIQVTMGVTEVLGIAS